MLDFHLIQDFESIGAHSAEVYNHVGGMDYSEFAFWKESGILEEDLDFFSNFRLTSEQVSEKLDKAMLIVANNNLPTTHQFIAILNNAKTKSSGLIAYAD